MTTEPRWDTLYRLAADQGGLFTTSDADAHGISPQLLHHHLKASRIERVRRKIYRVVHLPPDVDEQLVELWLWSDRAGVFSHDTALALHGLSDVLPVAIHLTLPSAWRARRLRKPEPLVLHHGDVEEHDWVGHVPVTPPGQTVRDCIADGLEPDLVEQAIDEGLRRGLFTRAQVAR
ncbi:MAG: type IV toxin-antitoxin system AbiEi family antitoxin domain-containing protein [Myxococcota bacterium]